jgi:predicted oxidoreductase
VLAQGLTDGVLSIFVKTCRIPQTDLVVSRLGLGLASIASWDTEPIRRDDIAKASDLILAAYEQGITLFDHADVYAFGKAESVFGCVLRQQPSLRDRIVIQSKCGQRLSRDSLDALARVDLSHKHIVSAVEGSLERLQTDHLDILLLHAVDALVRPEEVAQAFEDLHGNGKVRYFGVSNYDAFQIDLLKAYVRQPLVVNQIRLGLVDPGAVAEGMEFTLSLLRRGHGEGKSPAPVRSGTIEYCRMNGVQLQAWRPIRGIAKPDRESAQMRALLEAIGGVAQRRQTTCTAVALAWLLAHPVGIVPIVGTTDPNHLIEACAADHMSLSSEEWYDLFAAAVRQ